MPEGHCYDDVLSYLEICSQCVSAMANSGVIMSIQQKLVLKCYVRQVAFDAIKHALVASFVQLTLTKALSGSAHVAGVLAMGVVFKSWCDVC